MNVTVICVTSIKGCYGQAGCSVEPNSGVRLDRNGWCGGWMGENLLSIKGLPTL